MTASASSRPSPARALGYVGHVTDAVVARVGALTLLLARTGRGVVARAVRPRDVAYQVQAVGVRSLGLVVTMATFAGMVLAFQFGYGLERFGAKLYIGQTTVTALVRELGPILTALVAGGRIGAGIAAELGGMAVTEQLDAVRALGADPVQRLVAPRILAVTIAMPLLTIVADAVGAAGGLVIGWLQYGVPPRLFISGVEEFVTIGDFASGLVKSAVFGVIVGAIASAAGLDATGGTEGVGRATTRAVVAAALSVLAADFLLTKLMLTL
ncbi:MAG TPA: ABC transporter permease [Polyangia bacterium]